MANDKGVIADAPLFDDQAHAEDLQRLPFPASRTKPARSDLWGRKPKG